MFLGCGRMLLADVALDAAGRATVESKLSLDRWAHRICDVYRQALAEGRAGDLDAIPAGPSAPHDDAPRPTTLHVA